MNLFIITMIVLFFILYKFLEKKSKESHVWHNWISIGAIITIIIPFALFVINDIFRFFNYVDRLENKLLVVEMFSYPNTYVEFATFATLLGLLSILLQNREKEKETSALKLSIEKNDNLTNQLLKNIKELDEIKTILSEIKSDKVEIKTVQEPRKSKEQTSKDITLTIFSVAATLLFAKFYTNK